MSVDFTSGTRSRRVTSKRQLLDGPPAFYTVLVHCFSERYSISAGVKYGQYYSEYFDDEDDYGVSHVHV